MKTRERVKLNKVLKIVGAVTFVLMAGASYLGVSSARYMKEIVRDQFNEQQLVLARATALRIESTIQNAIADLVLLNSIPAFQYCDVGAYEHLLLSSLPVLYRDHLMEIRRVDRDGNTLFVANDQGIGMRHYGLIHYEAGVYLSWASDLSNRGKTMGTAIHPKDAGKGKRDMVIDLITPTYEDSTDSAHPRPSHRF